MVAACRNCCCYRAPDATHLHTRASSHVLSYRAGCTAAEFEGLVQRNMAANAGLGYAGLADLAATIAQRELMCLVRRGRVGGAAAAGGAPAASDAAATPDGVAGSDAAPANGGRAAEAAAACSGGVAGAGFPPPDAAALQHAFNLRRALFVLDELEKGTHDVQEDAGLPAFAVLSRQIRLAVEEIDLGL